MLYANSDDFFIKLIFVTIYANKIIYKISCVTVIWCCDCIVTKNNTKLKNSLP